MKIKSVTLNNVKSFGVEAKIRFGKKLNILIGPNSGGKSNLLEILQGVFNDIFFDDISFQENNDPKTKRLKPYKVDKRQTDQNHINQNILDEFEGKENQYQLVSMVLTIEKGDINNLEILKKIKDELVELEENETSSSLLKDSLRSINFNLDFTQIIGKAIEVKVENKNLIDTRSSYTDNALKEFYTFFKNSVIFQKYVHFYNITKNKIIKFQPYAFYVSPNRESVNLTNAPTLIDLTPISSISTNQLTQSGYTQDTKTNRWDFFLKVIADNHSLNRPSKNKNLRKLLNKHLGVDFSITKRGTRHHPLYEIRFTRVNNVGSIKLSSGEKELLNFIILTHLQSGGIFLIDEPELHLHRRWQKKLLNLLLEVSRKNNAQLILVTHSPHFVRSEVLGNLIRLYKENGMSRVVIPEREDLARKSQKDIFLFITSSNNEKVFFADKVILVEGVVDRIIFEAILQITQKLDNDEVIEIVESLGKDNFKRFSSFLDTWKINHSIIADNDYLKSIGSKEVRSLYAVSAKKIKKQIIKKSCKDANSLLKSLLKITKRKNPKKITLDEFRDLKELTDYIGKRNITLKDGLSDNEKSIIDTEIAKMKSKKIYILKKGEIEDYFNSGGKIDINEAITISKKIVKKKLTIPPELKEIITGITENDNNNQTNLQTPQAQKVV